MQKVVTSERQYTIGYYSPGTRKDYGISITVSGDKKAKVIKEAGEVLEAAQLKAFEIHRKHYGEVSGEDND